ncbi:MAG TPA: GntR family transcriptional regulator [Bryobacteraceae bacterium]|jgi:DNA-binding GntR family transcriptional regulator|nr:GntR family transcriptional regulator [Bryobacteraceae bacterium]
MESTAVRELPSATLKALVVDRIRGEIVSGRYKPGERLNESKLAREFKVSRIPVREALTKLHEQGLLMNHPRRGMFVNTLSEEDTQKINSVRIVLEAEALKLCRAKLTKERERHLDRLVVGMEQWERGSELDAAALDLDFHKAFWTYSDNNYLERTLSSLVPVLLAHHALDSIGHELVRWRLNHHRALLEVIQGTSKQTPEEAILVHLRIAYNSPERFSSLACTTIIGQRG